jgi:hypothetical protein
MKNRYIGRKKDAHAFMLEGKRCIFIPRAGTTHKEFKEFVKGLKDITSEALLEKAFMLSGETKAPDVELMGQNGDSFVELGDITSQSATPDGDSEIDDDAIIDDYDEDMSDAVIFEYGFITGYLVCNGYTIEEVADMDDALEVFDSLWDDESELSDDDPEPDGTGPHGKGNGPGKGQKDGSGMELDTEDLDEDLEEKKTRNRIRLCVAKPADKFTREDIIQLAERFSADSSVKTFLLNNVKNKKFKNLIKIRFSE